MASASRTLSTRACLALPFVENESIATRGASPLRGVDFDLWPGEVLGIAGVDGNGQKHLAEVLAGQRAAESGSITLGGVDVTKDAVPERRRRGVRYVTDERVGEGTVGVFSVATNLVLKEIGAQPFFRPQATIASPRLITVSREGHLQGFGRRFEPVPQPLQLPLVGAPALP